MRGVAIALVALCWPGVARAADLVVRTWRGTDAAVTVKAWDERAFRAGEVVAKGKAPLRASLPAGYYLVALGTQRVPIKLTARGLTLEVDLSPPEGWRFVPAGAFVYAGGFDGPMFIKTRRATLYLRAFYVGTHEVTNAEYARYLDAIANPIERRRRMPRAYHNSHAADNREREPDEYFWLGGVMPASIATHPVRGISCDDARAYARWLGARLATEPEWEKAARGVDGRRYPWGRDSAPIDGMGTRYHAVGKHPVDRSVYGGRDFASGVHEWTYTPGRPQLAVVKGGAFEHVRDEIRFLHAGWRMPMPHDAAPTGFDKGMRVVRSAVRATIGSLRDPDYGVRLEALQQLAARGAIDEADMLRMLQDREAAVREVAARQLLRRGEPGRRALMSAIELGRAGEEALDVVWRAAATDADVREALGALWLRHAALGRRLFRRANRSCSEAWPMRRHLPESAHGLIRARFVTLVNRKDLRLAERFATGPADEEALAAAYVANRAYVRALLAYRRAGKTPPAEELAAWTARAGKRSLARAMLLAAAGDHAGAAKILRLLAFGESKNLRALIELARSAVALGRLDEARQAVTRVDQLRPQVLELAGLRKRLASK